MILKMDLEMLKNKMDKLDSIKEEKAKLKKEYVT